METAAAHESTAVIEGPPQLDVVEMTKQFGSFTALEKASLRLRPGTVHALLGENGAGKSTLVKCVMGYYRPTSGQIQINQQSHIIHSPKDAHHYGIGMVYQHFTSVPAMTVAENLVLSRYDNQTLINWKREYTELRAFIADSPFQIDLDMPVAQLAAGQKQKLEILKQLYLKSRILILDEPTSVLTPVEADEVLGLLRQEVLAGKLSILMITHKFREVQAFADEVTILRKGKLAGQGSVKELSTEAMAEMMLGQERNTKSVAKTAGLEQTPVLSVEELHTLQDNGSASGERGESRRPHRRNRGHCWSVGQWPAGTGGGIGGAAAPHRRQPQGEWCSLYGYPRGDVSPSGLYSAGRTVAECLRA
jgi:ABC-type uncharacterized transport system ATPase subunit